MNSAVLLDTGYLKPIGKVTIADKKEISNIISTYHSLIEVKAHINQCVTGLQCLNIHSMMVKYPDLIKCLFVEGTSKQLTAGTCT